MWHSSSKGLDTPANRLAVWNLLHQYLPNSSCMKVQVRAPDFIQALVPQLLQSDEEAFGDDNICTEAKRVGYHKDCRVSSWSDTGTYEYNGLQDQAARVFWLPYALEVRNL